MHTSPLASDRDDEAFLFQVFAESRRSELSAGGLGGEPLEQLLRLQHQIQLASYARVFPDLTREIIFADELRIGHWCLARSARVIRLVDIALLPAQRSRGYGTLLLKTLQDEARRSGKSVELTVRPENPARRLYERLGFRAVHTSEVGVSMAWADS